jgi:hypothetical protein
MITIAIISAERIGIGAMPQILHHRSPAIT